MKSREEDRAVAVAAAIAEEMKALDKGAPVIEVSTDTRRKGRLELPALREASLREAIAEVYGQGTAHNN